MNQLGRRRDEFERFVWNHADDAFQAKFDHCAKLDRKQVSVLRRILRKESLTDVDHLTEELLSLLQQDHAILRKLLQLVGLTRNKLVQDVKAYARHHNLTISTSSPESVFNSQDGARHGATYLAKHLIRVFGHTRGKVTGPFLEGINQATWPGYIRQERAKRMGHEAEYRIACLFKDCGLSFEPEQKAENPLCPDIIIDGMSYDLVSPTASKPLLRVVATVHTANIGQFGESKDDLEIQKAINAMTAAGDRADVTLLAFIDGVGFESNSAGLNGILTNADEFCQFRTIWKAVAIAAQKVRRCVRVAITVSDHPRFKEFCLAYGAHLVDRNALDDAPADWVEAGDALVQII